MTVNEPVNEPGRRGKASERIAEILAATARVVARDGLADTTMSKVAEEAGLQRTLVLHYFKSRDELMDRFVSVAVAEYGAGLLNTGTATPLQHRIDAMFAPDAYASRDDLVIWIELVALAGRDEVVRKRLRDLWTKQWLPALEHQLGVDYPIASADARSAVAYALACLFEAHWAFDLQGVGGPDRRNQATQAAHALLASLETPKNETGNPVPK